MSSPTRSLLTKLNFQFSLAIILVMIYVLPVFSNQQCLVFYSFGTVRQYSWKNRIRINNPENAKEISRISNHISSNAQSLRDFLNGKVIQTWPKSSAEQFRKTAVTLIEHSDNFRYFGKWIIKNNCPQISSLRYLATFSNLQIVYNKLAEISQFKNPDLLTNSRLERIRSLLYSSVYRNYDPFYLERSDKENFRYYTAVEKSYNSIWKTQLTAREKAKNQEKGARDLEESEALAIAADAESKRDHLAKFPNELTPYGIGLMNIDLSLKLSSENVEPIFFSTPVGPIKIKIVEAHAGDGELLYQRFKDTAIVGYSLKGQISFDGYVKQDSYDFTSHDISHQVRNASADLHKFASWNVSNTKEIKSLNAAADALISARTNQIIQKFNEREKGILFFILNFQLFELNKYYPFLFLDENNYFSIMKYARGNLVQRLFNTDKLQFGEFVASISDAEISWAIPILKEWVARDQKAFVDMISENIPGSPVIDAVKKEINSFNQNEI